MSSANSTGERNDVMAWIIAIVAFVVLAAVVGIGTAEVARVVFR